MIISKKNFSNLEALIEEQEQTIVTLETKLRLQSTISNDVSALNVDLTKTNSQLEKRIAEQLNIIKSVESSYKRQQHQLNLSKQELEELKLEYGRQQIKHQRQELELEKLHEMVQKQNDFMEEKTKEIQQLQHSIELMRKERKNWEQDKSNYIALISDLQNQLKKAKQKIQEIKQSSSTDVLQKLKLFRR